MVDFLEDTELVIDHTNLASYTAMQLCFFCFLFNWHLSKRCFKKKNLIPVNNVCLLHKQSQAADS